MTCEGSVNTVTVRGGSQDTKAAPDDNGESQNGEQSLLSDGDGRHGGLQGRAQWAQMWDLRDAIIERSEK